MLATLRRVPTTKVRVLVSVGLTVWTAYQVLVVHYMPSWEWFVFLSANSGIDLVQYSQNLKKKPVTEKDDVSEVVG